MSILLPTTLCAYCYLNLNDDELRHQIKYFFSGHTVKTAAVPGKSNISPSSTVHCLSAPSLYLKVSPSIIWLFRVQVEKSEESFFKSTQLNVSVLKFKSDCLLSNCIFIQYQRRKIEKKVSTTHGLDTVCAQQYSLSKDSRQR